MAQLVLEIIMPRHTFKFLSTCSKFQENSTKDYESQELDDLILQMAKAEQDESILKQENESLKEEIETLKSSLSRRVSDKTSK